MPDVCVKTLLPVMHLPPLLLLLLLAFVELFVETASVRKPLSPHSFPPPARAALGHHPTLLDGSLLERRKTRIKNR